MRSADNPRLRREARRSMSNHETPESGSLSVLLQDTLEWVDRINGGPRPDPGLVIQTDDFRLSWIEAFVAVYRLGTYSSAGKVLNVSQSTVSRRVANLEAWFGGHLFTKTKPPRISSFGRSRINLCEDIFHKLCSYEDLMMRLSGGSSLSEQDSERYHTALSIASFKTKAEIIAEQTDF